MQNESNLQTARELSQATIYDLVNDKREYLDEVAKIHRIIKRHYQYEWDGKSKYMLLDVGCATGRYISIKATFLHFNIQGYFKRYSQYTVTGLEQSSELLDQARLTNPDIIFHQGYILHLFA
jgi:SAM-dependent methyltransferase